MKYEITVIRETRNKDIFYVEANSKEEAEDYVYENSDIGDAAAFFDNLFQYTKYYENFYEFVEDNSLKDYIIYKDDTETKEPTDEIDIEKTYENIQDNCEEIQFYGDEYRGYITY